MSSVDNLQSLTTPWSMNAKRGRRDIHDADVESNEPEMKNILLTLSAKMDSLNIAMSEVDKRLDIKIDNMESSLRHMVSEVKDAMDQRFESFSVNFEQRLNDVNVSCIRNCEEATKALSSKVFSHMDEVRASHEHRLDKLERMSLANEMIISGVPVEKNDDPLAVIGDICHALNCKLQQRDVAAAYRDKYNHANLKANRAVPIVVKLHEGWAVSEIFHCYFKKGDLNLKDIGFKSAARIFINESLTKSNREIFKLASEAKKASLIVKFHTRNGLVHVQRYDTSKPVCIHHISELQQMVPPPLKCADNQTNRRRSNNCAMPNSSTTNAVSLSVSSAVTSIVAVSPSNELNDKKTIMDHTTLATTN